MKFNIFLYIFLSLVFSEQSEVVQLKDNSEEVFAPDHISMLVHEDLINEFFNNMGVIIGGGKNYEWRLKNSRIEITNEKAIFLIKPLHTAEVTSSI